MTKQKEYESKEYLIANFARVAAEMDAMNGPHVVLPFRSRPRKVEVGTPMIGKPVDFPETD